MSENLANSLGLPKASFTPGQTVWYYPNEKFHAFLGMKIQAKFLRISGKGRAKIQFKDFRTGKEVVREVSDKDMKPIERKS